MQLIPESQLERPITDAQSALLRNRMQLLIDSGARFYILRSNTKIPAHKWGGKKQDKPGILTADCMDCYLVGQTLGLVPSSVNAVVLDNDYLEGEELIEFETQVEDDILINVPSQTTPRAHVWFPCKHDVKEGGWQYNGTTAGEIKSYGIVAIKSQARLYNIVNALLDGKGRASLPKDYFDSFRKRGVRFSEPIEPARRRLACTTVEIEQHIEHYKTGDNPAYQTEDGKWTNFPCIYQHDRKHIHSKDTRGAYYNPADGYHGCTAHEAHSGYARDAEVELRGGARDGAGRPVGIPNTNAGRPPEFKEPTDLALHLRYSQPHAADVERLLHYRKEDLIFIRYKTARQLAVFNSDSTLEIFAYNKTSAHQSSIHYQLTLARKSALEDLKKFLKENEEDEEIRREHIDKFLEKLPNSARHVQGTTSLLINRTHSGVDEIGTIKTINIEDVDCFHKYSVLPTYSTGAISLKDGSQLPKEAIKQCYFTGRWTSLADGFDYKAILKSNSTTLTMLRQMFSEQGRFAGCLTMFARYLHGTTKDIDIIKAEQSNYGKSTLLALFRKAFPRLVKELDGSTIFGRKETRFNPFTQAMTEHLAVLIDEADKVEDINPALILKMTSTTLDVELKGQDEETKERTGTMVLIGANWPDIDTTYQGVKERIAVALDLKGHDILTRKEYEDCNTDEAVQFFRAMLIEEAVSLYQQSLKVGEHVLEFAKAKIAHLNKRTDFIDSRKNQLVLEVQREIGHLGRVSNKELSDLLERLAKETGETQPKGKNVRAFLERCFTGVSSYKSGSSRGWSYEPIRRLEVKSTSGNVISTNFEQTKIETPQNEDDPVIGEDDEPYF